MAFVFGVIVIAIVLIYSSHVQIHEIDRDTRKDINLQDRL